MAEMAIKPHSHISKGAYVKTMKQYEKQYQESIEKNEHFWSEKAKELLTWSRPFTSVRTGGFEEGDIAWFQDGEVNACFNCVDRHAIKTPEKIALIHEGDEPGDVRNITYGQLLREVCRVANYLKSLGLQKGDRVAIYMPNIPEAAIAMLACARIGVVHSVVFGGFSAEALRSRIEDAECKVVFTSNQGLRGKKVIPLKKTVDHALDGHCPSVQKVIVYKHTQDEVPFHPPRDVWWHEATKLQRPYCPPTATNSEDTLFLLYTSGSTGKPKGVVHTTGGYLLHASFTHKYVFDYREGEIYACMADVGWITGHSYIVYGPLCNGATSVIFEGLPTYPDGGRYWDMVQRLKINQFYTAPTAIRALKRLGDSFVTKYDRSSLRILGSVGEPINPEAWRWYYEVIGESNCALVDTFWQTETGGLMITPLPGATPVKMGSATLPFFGVEPVIIDPQSGKVLEGNGVEGVLCFASPWPSIARSVYGDHQRYLETYLKPYPGYYFTGDGAFRDEDGYYWIRGRVDDVINVSGHRLGTAEIESALVKTPLCSEAAVVGAPDDLTGQAIFAFCILKQGVEMSHDEILKDLKDQVREEIGPIATPKKIFLVPNLPKTRSGKIMRRILRKISAGESDQLGDITTLADPDIVQVIIDMVAKGN